MDDGDLRSKEEGVLVAPLLVSDDAQLVPFPAEPQHGLDKVRTMEAIPTRPETCDAAEDHV